MYHLRVYQNSFVYTKSLGIELSFFDVRSGGNHLPDVAGGERSRSEANLGRFDQHRNDCEKYVPIVSPEEDEDRLFHTLL